MKQIYSFALIVWMMISFLCGNIMANAELIQEKKYAYPGN